MKAERGSLLLVDNCPSRRDGLHAQLDALGYAVQTTHRVELLAQTEGDCPEADGVDLALVDIQVLTSMADSALAQRVDSVRSGGIPIIAVAGLEYAPEVAAWLDRGVADYLLTPCEPALLRARLDACLERERLRAQCTRDAIEYQRAVEALRASEKYERDVHIGQQIQASFLPSVLPTLPGWEIAARFKPAREVAGDWYDAFSVGHLNRVGLVIADVCDKGVGAALFMGLMRSLIRAFAQQPTPLRWMEGLSAPGAAPASGETSRRRVVPITGSTSLINAVEQTNNYVATNHTDTGMFATLFFGLLDPITGGLIYINGGHEAPILISASGEIKARLQPTGLAVGMLAGSEYNVDVVQLAPGDLLVAYTDGVPEARNPAGHFFTEPELLSVVAQPATGASDLLDRILDHLHAHIADRDQYDDITMLAVHRSESAAGEHA